MKQDLAKIQNLLVEADFRLDSVTNDGEDDWIWVVLHTAYDSIVKTSSCFRISPDIQCLQKKFFLTCLSSMQKTLDINSN